MGKISNIDRVGRLLHAIATHDEDTYRHSVLVAHLSASFAEYLGLGDEHIAQIVEAALLHDVGKLGVSANLLNKQESLSAEKAEKLDTAYSHALAGYKLLDAIGEYSEEVLRTVRHHHEKMDGSGYPDGLFGDEIPFVARFIAICDIYAALSEPRLYKARLATFEALRTMRGMQGKLDPEFLRQFHGFVNIRSLGLREDESHQTASCKGKDAESGKQAKIMPISIGHLNYPAERVLASADESSADFHRRSQ